MFNRGIDIKYPWCMQCLAGAFVQSAVHSGCVLRQFGFTISLLCFAATLTLLVDQCDSCGGDISIKRLQARPVTTLCIECKTAQEQEERTRLD